MTRRLAALVAVAPLLAAGPAQAQRPIGEIARDILSGCYGVAVTVCGPRVSSNPVDLDGTPVQVCTGACEWHYLPGPSGEPLCVSWTDASGRPHQQCSQIDL